MMVYSVVAVLGLVLGSFAGATVWRLRARQLVEDAAAGEAHDKRELQRLKPLANGMFGARDRSRCLECRHELAWFDLLPLVSWLSTGGACRYCKKPIGWFEPAIEIGTATLFVSVYHHWLSTSTVAAWPLLVGWLAVTTLLVILLAYDAKWFLLPNAVMFPLIGLAFVMAAVNIALATEPLLALASTAGSVAILGGLYLVLWLVSRGAWVGFGDVKLGLALGLLLGDWLLAFLTLFAANLIGVLIVLPGLASGRLSRKAHVPFGPMLIAGFFVALFFGYQLASSWLLLTF